MGSSFLLARVEPRVAFGCLDLVLPFFLFCSCHLCMPIVLFASCLLFVFFPLLPFGLRSSVACGGSFGCLLERRSLSKYGLVRHVCDWSFTSHVEGGLASHTKVSGADKFGIVAMLASKPPPPVPRPPSLIPCLPKKSYEVLGLPRTS